MKMIKRMIHFICILVMASIAGCASAPKRDSNIRYVWPSPPETPRLEYVGAYSNVNDLVEKNMLYSIVGMDLETTLQNPTAVVSDGAGNVYVSDLFEKVVKFDFTAKTVDNYGGDIVAKVIRASGIDMDAEGNIYVGDMNIPQIAVIDKDGRGSKMLEFKERIKSVNFLAIDRERKRIVIPDTLGHEVHIVDFTGKIIKTIRNFRDGDGFTQPGAVAIDRLGNIIVVDTMGARIVRFTPEGEYLSHFGQRGDGNADFNLAKGVAVDSDGHIYVTDAKSNKIMVFNEKGDALIVIGWFDSTKRMIGGFSVPLGISIDRNDRIYVVDRMNKRFQIYQYMNSGYMAKNPITSDTVLAKPTEKKEGVKK